jgi:PAS domain S-box-containing protein
MQFLKGGMRPIPIVDAQNKPVGIVSANDFIAVLSNGIDAMAPVSEILSTNYQTIEENQPLECLLECSIENILVVDGSGHLTGIIDQADLERINGWRSFTDNLFLSGILKNLDIGFIAVDVNEKVMFCNSFIEKIVKLTRNDIIGHRLSTLFDDDLVSRVLSSGKAIDGGRIEFEERTIARNGYPIKLGTSVIGAIELFQDISDKENLINELSNTKALNKELDGIIESSYDGIVVTDDKGKLMRISKSYSRICGIPSEKLPECIGKYVGDLGGNGESHESGSADDSLLVLSNQKPTTISRKLWNTTELAITGNPIFSDDGNIERVVWNIRDISELNTLKREIQENKYLTDRYYTELEELRARYLKTEGVVIQSQEMKKIMETAIRVAKVDATVLITGETGAGKEIIAKLIHKASSRRDRPFILVNCGAIPENLLESELFGYESGAFTGAKRSGKIGLVEAANLGTLFLDEIGDMPLSLQVKLLRVLQNKQIVRIGGTRNIKLDLRILAATNQNLKQLVNENKFREDLFYRLNVIPIILPPLRNRKDDIIPLARSFLEKYGRKYQIKKTISQEAFETLEIHSWPGNVRELENLIERVLITTEDDLILPMHFKSYFEGGRDMPSTPIKVSELLPLKEARELLEKELLEQALSSGFSTRKVANILKVDHSTIVRKMNKYKVTK